MTYPEYVRSAIDTLESAGHEAYVVGGGLRDMLLGRAPDDYDIATSALPEQIQSVFRSCQTIPTGIKHGTVTVILDGHPLEITTYRIDGRYLDSRHPESVSFTSKIEEDLSRRDFTVNAMAYNEKRGFVDVFGGKRDLKNKILRAVGDPERRMDEDALRIMRALRFSAQLSFDIEPQTYSALASKAHLLHNVSAERKGAELIKLILARHPENAFGDMINTGVWNILCPDFCPSKASVAALGTVDPDPCERLAVILHDCERKIADNFLHSMKYSNHIISTTLTICCAECSPAPNDADIRRFIARYKELALPIARVAIALGKSGIPTEQEIKKVSEQKFCKSIDELAIKGQTLVDMGFRGKDIGRALEQLLSDVLTVPERNSTEYLIAQAQKIKEKITEDGKNT